MACIININYNYHMDISRAKLTNVRKLYSDKDDHIKKYIELEFDNNFWMHIKNVEEDAIDEIIKNIPERLKNIIETNKNKSISINEFIEMLTK